MIRDPSDGSTMPAPDDCRIVSSPAWDALHAFDAENNVEPTRTVAERIAERHGFDEMHPIVDDISFAIEDAMNLGKRRGPLENAAIKSSTEA